MEGPDPDGAHKVGVLGSSVQELRLCGGLEGFVPKSIQQRVAWAAQGDKFGSGHRYTFLALLCTYVQHTGQPIHDDALRTWRSSIVATHDPDPQGHRVGPHTLPPPGGSLVLAVARPGSGLCPNGSSSCSRGITTDRRTGRLSRHRSWALSHRLRATPIPRNYHDLRR